MWYGTRSLRYVVMKTGELIRRLEAGGWYRVRQTGSHAIFRHPVRAGQLTVPVHPGKDIPHRLAARLMKAAGLQ